jgi:hypothetical protein
MKLKVKVLLVTAIAILMNVAFVNINGQSGDTEYQYGRNTHEAPDSCRIQLMVEHLAKDLLLTNDQKQRILQINYAHMNDIKTIKAKFRNDCVGEDEAHRQAMQKKDDEIKAVLNDPQKAKFDDMLKKQKEPHHEGHGERQEHERE